MQAAAGEPPLLAELRRYPGAIARIEAGEVRDRLADRSALHPRTLVVLGTVVVLGAVFPGKDVAEDGAVREPVLETRLVVDWLYFLLAAIFSRRSTVGRTYCLICMLFLALLLRVLEREVRERMGRQLHLGYRGSVKRAIFTGLTTAVLCVVAGSLVTWGFEGRDFGDSTEMSNTVILSAGLVGFHFRTLYGRLFGSLWLLISIVAVSKSVLWIYEAVTSPDEREIRRQVRDHIYHLMMSSEISTEGVLYHPVPSARF